MRHQRLKTHDGLLVRLQQGKRQGWGEIAPLPKFSQETLAQATQATLAWLKSWQVGKTPADSPLPSVAFGLSCALAECKQCPPLQADYRKAPLCSGNPDKLFQVLSGVTGREARQAGSKLYKVMRDGIIVNLLLEALPDLHLRLDANRSWMRAKADGFAKYLNPAWRTRITFLEESCKTRDESRDFTMATDIAVAWDESVREADLWCVCNPA